MILSCLFRCFPWLFWRWYGRQARRRGLNRLYLVLSFDCDTPEDIPAAERVYAWLQERDIKATFAVPGQQLKEGAGTYRRMADQGADFINHGALPHAEWRGNRYWSITFYHEMSAEKVAEDIHKGHDIVTQIIGRPPRGFRAPHFGLFQAPQQLDLLHNTLRELDYRYSTSTTPGVGLQHGPVWDVGDLFEVPLSGPLRSPLTVLDSWGHIAAPCQPHVTDSYTRLFTQTVDQVLAWGIPGVLNYYVDPAHVVNGTALFRALDYVIERRVPILDYDELLDLVEE